MATFPGSHCKIYKLVYTCAITCTVFSWNIFVIFSSYGFSGFANIVLSLICDRASFLLMMAISKFAIVLSIYNNLGYCDKKLIDGRFDAEILHWILDNKRKKEKKGKKKRRRSCVCVCVCSFCMIIRSNNIVQAWWFTRFVDFLLLYSVGVLGTICMELVDLVYFGI